MGSLYKTEYALYGPKWAPGARPGQGYHGYGQAHHVPDIAHISIYLSLSLYICICRNVYLIETIGI